MEEAVRIERSQGGNHGRIGPKEDTKNISNRKDEKDKSHVIG
jgi:hypothetical protein